MVSFHWLIQAASWGLVALWKMKHQERCLEHRWQMNSETNKAQLTVQVLAYSKAIRKAKHSYFSLSLKGLWQETNIINKFLYRFLCLCVYFNISTTGEKNKVLLGNNSSEEYILMTPIKWRCYPKIEKENFLNEFKIFIVWLLEGKKLSSKIVKHN